MKYFILSCFFICFYFSNAQNTADFNVLNVDFTERTLSKQYIYSETDDCKELSAVLLADSLFQFQEKKFLNSGIFNHYNWIKVKIKNRSNTQSWSEDLFFRLFCFHKAYIITN